MPPRGCKGGRRPGAGRKPPQWRTAVVDGRSGAERGVYIGTQNVRRWILLKETLGFVNDTDFASYLLNLAEKRASPPKTKHALDTVEMKIDNVENQMEKRSAMVESRISPLYEGDSEFEDDSYGDDEDDDDWRPSGCRQMRVLKRPSRGRRKFDSVRQTRSRKKIYDRFEEHESKTNNTTISSQIDAQEEVEEKDEELALSPLLTNSSAPSPTGTHKTEIYKTVVARIRNCPECGQKHAPGDCPLSCPVAVVRDSPWDPDSLLVQAEATLPKILKLETFEKSHGLSVFAVEKIQSFTQFGPLLGKSVTEAGISEDANLKYIWEIFGDTKLYLDTSDANCSNWLRYIRPAPTRDERNITTVTRDNYCLYFITIKDIQAGSELLYWSDDPTITWSKKKLEKTSCGGCNQQFEHPLYYRIHCMIFHDPNFSLTIRKYHCKICGVAVLGKENIMKHAMEMHEGKGAYQCQYCKKFFLRLNYLEMHRTYGCRLNPQRSRPLCDLCGKKFCQPQKLKVHIRRMHSDTHVSYSCKLNPWKTHPLCETCGKKFCQPQHLRAHIKRMHSDMSEVLKEFQCKTCFKLLGSRAALQRHLKEVHNKDQNIAATCDRCGKTFQNKSNLKIHMLTHSGVKPFRCVEMECTAAFTTKQCLQFHYKKVHGYDMHNMPLIERCVAYTFESYSGGILTYHKKESKIKLKANIEENSLPANHNQNSDEENSNDLQKSFQLCPEKLVEAALKTIDSSSLSSLTSENVPCIKREDSQVQHLDSTSENSIVDSLDNTTVSSDTHEVRTRSMDSAAHHSDILLPSCSPKSLSPASKCQSIESLNRQALTIQRQTQLLSLGLSPRSMLEIRECKSANQTRIVEPFQQLEPLTLDVNRQNSDLISSSQYSNLALCLARQRAELISSGINTDIKPCNQSERSVNNTNSMNIDDHPSHRLDMTIHSEDNGISRRMDNSNVSQHHKPNRNVTCSTDQQLELHHTSEQNLDLAHNSDHNLDLARHSENNISTTCHSEQSLELHRTIDSTLSICHPSESNLELMHHHNHHNMEINNSNSHSVELLNRHVTHELRRHVEQDISLAHQGEQGTLELIHQPGRRSIHVDLNQHNERGSIMNSRLRMDHTLSIAVGRNLDLDTSDHRLDISPHPPHMSSPLRREHLLEMAAHEASSELVHTLSRSGHLDGNRHHSDIRNSLLLSDHHSYNVVQHRTDMPSPINRHHDQSLDMSCHTSNLNSPTPSRCSDLHSPLPHQDTNLDLTRQTNTPTEISRPPSHSIDLTTGRPSSLSVDINRPPSHGGRQMPAELIPLESTRMVSPGYQAYSSPVYQSAPPAHMPSPSPSIHSSYHYPGYY